MIPLSKKKLHIIAGYKLVRKVKKNQGIQKLKKVGEFFFQKEIFGEESTNFLLTNFFVLFHNYLKYKLQLAIVNKSNVDFSQN